MPLDNGALAVIPTDTLYGLVCSALNPDAVEYLYATRQRDTSKPCIILLASATDLPLFDISLSPAMQAQLDAYWPGPTSVILPCASPKWRYLHRGADSLAFRVPDSPDLINLLSQTGPLLAPSANPEGNPPATTIAAAQQYFGAQVHSYVDAGRLERPPSRLVRLRGDGSVEVLRP